MAIENPTKKMLLSWAEFCRMMEAYHDQIIKEKQKEKDQCQSVERAARK